MVANLFPLFAFILIFFTLFSHVISSGSGDEKPNPFEFLKGLQGCQKGEKVQELGKLKRYLKTLGYLNYPHQVDDDEFDELLEEAIKTYQLNYNLEISGSLDLATVTKMMMRRCGIADIHNGSTSMRSGKQQQQHNHGSLHTVAHYSFFPGTPKWPASKTHLTYSFLSNGDVLRPPCAKALQKWASVSHFTFDETPNYNTSDLKISFQIGDHGDGIPFDGPGGVLAHAFAPTDGRLHFDGEEPWSTDLEAAALHEIGHILGLGHSSVENAIMFPTAPFGNSKSLHSDDIEGIRALYGVTNREITPKVYTLRTPVKTYQLNYNLNISGSIDSATVNKMMMPRCGVADIIDSSTSMRSGKQRQQHSHGSGSLHTVAHYSFFAGTPRWPASKTHLTYSFLSDADVLGPPCARAFQKWASVSHFTFEETPNYNTADIKISFQIGNHGDSSPFDGPGGVLAHAFAPTDGRLHFDGQEPWATSPTAGKFDLETVALHDIGHILGLGHSSVASGMSKNLHGDDIQGIRSLYGSTNREIIPKGTNVYALVCPI
ncbi:hypothetical protein F0562_033383 [Nyssa sinensis]|uniref:Peptidase metallopeptidase domain-containing protein n=1 Tax=Nyssa sinensis TaxID=561372 RepID=A0A5J5AS54_9ASTE|nr:hypothetical protein F0562_033383 [Nyssa sinensis]